jgi:hypothetical protein
LDVQISANAKLWDTLEHQEEALVYLIFMQEGSNPLFGPLSFDNKFANFVLVLASLVLRCFHVFCGFLTSFRFPIMCEKINYLL